MSDIQKENIKSTENIKTEAENQKNLAGKTESENSSKNTENTKADVEGKDASSKPKSHKHDYKLKSKMVEMPESVKVPVTASDLVVVTKVKDLVNYIFQVTEKSPKKFRFTFVNRLHNWGLDVIENLYRANDIDMRQISDEKLARRRNFQNEAMTDLKLLEYMALLALENECITFHQYEFMAKSGGNCMILLANWIDSDERRKKWQEGQKNS